MAKYCWLWDEEWKIFPEFAPCQVCTQLHVAAGTLHTFPSEFNSKYSERCSCSNRGIGLTWRHLKYWFRRSKDNKAFWFRTIVLPSIRKLYASRSRITNGCILKTFFAHKTMLLANNINLFRERQNYICYKVYWKKKQSITKSYSTISLLCVIRTNIKELKEVLCL